jgi:hypothetical protein
MCMYKYELYILMIIFKMEIFLPSQHGALLYTTDVIQNYHENIKNFI